MMYHPCSARNSQRTNPHSEALPSKKTALPAPCPEMVKTKAYTEDINKTRAKARRPDMQLYVPRARRSQIAPGTSVSLDIHSSEKIQSCQTDSKCSEISFEMIENCSSSIPNLRQNKCEENVHLLQSNIEHQEDQLETENLNDNPDFNRICNDTKNVKLSASQFLQNCSPKNILYTEKSAEDRRNILNVQNDDGSKIILNQNSSILSRKAHIANLPENVPDFDCTESTNQRERNDIAEYIHSSLHICDCEVKSNLCNSTDCLDSALVEIKFDALSDSKHSCLEKEFCLGKNYIQPETKDLSSGILNEDTEQFQAICKTIRLEEQEFAKEKERIFLNNEKHSAGLDTTRITHCKDFFPELETTNAIQCEEKNSSIKITETLSASVLETSKDMEISLESIETDTNLDSNDEANIPSKSSNDDSWDSMFDDSGECLNPEILKELTAAVGDMKITKSKYNYYEFQPHEPDVSGEEFGHIVEFYDFPVEFKNQDLLTIISAFKNEAFNIKWVDDTHALGVFSSPMAAMGALSLNHPLLKVRPLSQGIRESKFKAKRCSEFLQPYRPRPETSATIARRLVSGALGVRVQIPKEQRELERKRLKEARDKRRQAAKQKQDIWDGVVS